MSKSKFNLKNYQATNGDDHIDRKLQKEHEEAPTSITEKQLDGNRITEKDVILEKLLDAKRLGSADVIIEKNLNDSKGMFAPLRNSDTHTGNINKVEEKRLAGDKMEDEKYESSSKTPKSERWWEHLASNSSRIVTAAPKSRARELVEEKNESFNNPAKSLERAREMGYGDEANEGLVPDRGDTGNEFVADTTEQDGVDQEETDQSLDLGGKVMNFTNIKINEGPVPSIMFQLTYDPVDFENDLEEIKQVALDKILIKYPSLADKISTDSFNNPVRKGNQTFISLVEVGPEFVQATKQQEASNELFSNYDVEEADMGGTEVTLGRIKLSPRAVEMASESREELVDLLTEYVVEQDPEMSGVGIADYFNFSALPKGEITFVIGSPQENDMAADSPETELSDLTEESPEDTEDFPINDIGTENTIANSNNTIKTASEFGKSKEQRDQKKN